MSKEEDEKYNIELLEANGWTVECESPFEIRHEDGSFASGYAASGILKILEEIETESLELKESGCKP